MSTITAPYFDSIWLLCHYGVLTHEKEWSISDNGYLTFSCAEQYILCLLELVLLKNDYGKTQVT